MANKFNIIEYAGSLIGYPVPRTVVERIVNERGIADVKSWDEVTTRDKNLTIASLLFYLFTSPNDTGSKSKTHNNFTVSVGGVKIYDKNDIFTLMNRIWQNPDAELWELMDGMGECFFLDVL